jgi:hypothetical protein
MFTINHFQVFVFHDLEQQSEETINFLYELLK